MKKIFEILFLLSMTAFVLSAAEDGEIEAVSGNIKVNFETEEFSADGGLRVSYEDIKIQANKIKKVKDKNILIAYEKVIFQQGTQKVEADELELDLDSKKAKVVNGKTFSDKVYYGGKSLVLEFPEKVTVADSRFTTCSYDDPHYRFEAKRIEFFPGKKIVAYDCTLYIGNTALFTLPYYVSSLREGEKRASLFPRIGTDAERGWFVIWGTDYEFDKKYLSGFIDLELSQKKGVAIEWLNEYEISEGNAGNLHLARLLIPSQNIPMEWDFAWKHKTDLKAKENDLIGDSKIESFFQNKTTNLMKDSKGNLVEADSKDAFTKIVASGIQKFGKDTTIEGKIEWVNNKNVLQKIVDAEKKYDTEQSNRKLETKVSGTIDNNDYRLKLAYENSDDLDPGGPNDVFSFKRGKSASLNLKPIKLEVDYSINEEDVWKYPKFYGELTTKYTIPDYEIRNNENYSLKLGDYFIGATGIYYKLSFRQNDEYYKQRKYSVEEKDKDLVWTTEEKKVSYKEAQLNTGNQSIKIFEKNNLKLNYEAAKRWYKTSEQLILQTYNGTLESKLFSNTDDEERTFDLEVTNIPSFLIAFGIGDAPTGSYPDRREEFSDNLNVNLGNIETEYRVELKNGFYGATGVSKYDKLSNRIMTKLGTTMVEVKYSNDNNYSDIDRFKNDTTQGVAFTLRDNEKKYIIENSASKTFGKEYLLGNEKTSRNETKYQYAEANFGISLTNYLIKETTSTTAITKDYSKNTVLIVTDNKDPIINQVFKLDYSGGYESITKAKDDTFVRFDYKMTDKSEEDEKEKQKLKKAQEDKIKEEEEKRKNIEKATDSQLKLYDKESEEVEDILKESEKKKVPFDLTGIGEEKSTTQNLLSKTYGAVIGVYSDDRWLDSNGWGIENYFKSLKKLDVTLNYQDKNTIMGTYTKAFSRAASLGAVTTNKSTYFAKYMIGDRDYEWWLSYTLENDDNAGKATLTKYAVEHSFHCTRLQLAYSDIWNTAKNKYDFKIEFKFYITAFPDKSIEGKFEAEKDASLTGGI